MNITLNMLKGRPSFNIKLNEPIKYTINVTSESLKWVQGLSNFNLWYTFYPQKEWDWILNLTFRFFSVSHLNSRYLWSLQLQETID